MTHYEVLGVSRSADQEELRRAYLRLVRRHHPDRYAGAPIDQRVAAEDRMRRLNDAWHDLGDPDRRRRYDATLDRVPRATVVDHQGTSSWRPIDEGDDVIDERLDDSHRPPPRGGRILAMGPPAVLTAGVVLSVLGFGVGMRPLVAVGAMGVILGIALFVLASLSVVLESRQNDLR